MDKKKIFAIVLFLIMGFFMFTFANPSQELERVPGNDTEEKEDENKQDENKDDQNTETNENETETNENETETNENENDQDDEDVVVEVNNAPTITVTPEIVKILKGESYNILNGVVVEDEEELTANASLIDTTKLEIGSHEVTYIVTDNAGQTATAKRTIIVLDPKGDEDNDGYTNEEEKEAGTDFDDKEEYPDYQPNPTIDLTACDKEMTVYDLTPDFGTCVKATDEYYGTEGVEVNVDTTKVNPNKFGSYEVTVKATDNLGNETVETFTLKVLKREVTLTINDVNATYGDELHELTSNANEVAYNNHDILVTLNTEATKNSDAGKYAITGTWANDNYDVTFVDGTYNVSAKDLTEEDLASFGVTFKDRTVIYNGKMHHVPLRGVENLPEGFTYKLENHQGIEVGTYHATATITAGGNYTGELKLNADLIIEPKELTEEDLASFGVTFKDRTVIYNGKMHHVPLRGVENLPEGFTYKLENHQGIEVGTYHATATITAGGNYTGELKLNADLIIEPKELTEEDLASFGVTFKDRTVIYNGNYHNVPLRGNLPEGFNVQYVNNQGIDAGIYNAKAIVTGNSNYTGTVVLEAKLVIERAYVVIKADDQSSKVGQPLNALTYTIVAGQIYNNDFEPKLVANVITTEKNTGKIMVFAEHKNYNIEVQYGTYKVFEDLNNNDIDDDLEDKYTVIFNNDGMIIGHIENLLYGQQFNNPVDNPTKEKTFTTVYNFVNWDEHDWSKVDEESKTLVINANYSEETRYYTVQYLGYNNDVFETVSNVTYEAEVSKPSTNPTYKTETTIYNFIGWDELDWSTVTIDQDTILVNSNWDNGVTRYYTIQFLGYNGTVLTSQNSVEYGSEINYPTDVQPYMTADKVYHFVKWHEFDWNVIPSDWTTINVVSEWDNGTPRLYTVTFTNYDSNNSTTQCEVEYGSAATCVPEYETVREIYHSGTDTTTYVRWTGWDKDFSRVTGDITVSGTYNAVDHAYTRVFILKDGVERPENGEGLDSSYYTLAISQLEIIDDFKGSLSKAIEESKTSSSNEGILALDNIENFLPEKSKAALKALELELEEGYHYEWYVVKYNNGDGWHLDGQKVANK